MFNDTKYTKCYYRIIEAAQCKTKDLFIGERHHIIPKSLGGTNKKTNIVKLTPREHYICHLLLTRMCNYKPNKIKMCRAFQAMRLKPADGINRIINNKAYNARRIYLTEFYSGENNPFYGKKHTKASREKMSIGNKKYLETHVNCFYGKHHSDETKEHLSNMRSISIEVEFMDGKIVHFKNRLKLGTYLNRSEHLGAKLLKPMFKHIWKNYNIKDIRL